MATGALVIFRRRADLVFARSRLSFSGMSMSSTVLPLDPLDQHREVPSTGFPSDQSPASTSDGVPQATVNAVVAIDLPTVVVPDRADAPIPEITERFFRALLLKVPLDRIEELHLFSPLRQGGVETGIAVIAAREEILPESVVVEIEPGSAFVVAQPVVPTVRHTVYTARYRLAQKGPERGKWETDVVAEAEAPLITVEMVVRGVLRRAGQESDTTRFSAAQIARALRLQLGAA